MPADHRIRLRRMAAVLLYVLAVAFGVGQALQWDSRVVSLLLPFAVASAVTLWCVVDSHIRARPILTSLQFLVFITWPVAVPIYLIWSRRLRGIVLAVVHGVGLTFVLAAPVGLTTYLADRAARDGHAALGNQDYDEAARLLRRAVALRTDDASSWYNLGAALYGQGRLPEAVEALQEALRLDAGLSQSRGLLLDCHFRIAYNAQMGGDPATAIAHYGEVLAIDASQPAAWHNLAVALDATGDSAAAVYAAESACRLEVENAQYLGTLKALRRRAEQSESPH